MAKWEFLKFKDLYKWLKVLGAIWCFPIYLKHKVAFSFSSLNDHPVLYWFTDPVILARNKGFYVGLFRRFVGRHLRLKTKNEQIDRGNPGNKFRVWNDGKQSSVQQYRFMVQKRQQLQLLKSSYCWQQQEWAPTLLNDHSSLIPWTSRCGPFGWNCSNLSHANWGITLTYMQLSIFLYSK